MKAFYFAIFASMAWGIAPIFEKLGINKIAPAAGLIIRCFGVMAGLIILSLFNIGNLKLALSARPGVILYIMLGGFIASIIGQIFFYNALKIGEVSRVVPIAATYPLISFLFGVIFLGESFTFIKGIGIALLMAGLFFLR